MSLSLSEGSKPSCSSNNLLYSTYLAVEIASWETRRFKNEDLKINAQIIKAQVIRGAKLVSIIRKLSQLEEDRQSLKKIEILKVLKNSISFVKKSYKDKEFIELASEIGNYKPKILSVHKIVKKSR